MQLHILERDGCPIHYWTGGPPDRPWLVLTHGMTMDHRLFERQMPELLERYRVLLWDVRGHGLSRPMGEGFSIKMAVDDLVAILDEMQIAQAVFIGISMGGFISQEMVFYHPERVRGLVVLDSLCITTKRTAGLKLMSLISPLVFKICPESLIWWFGGWCAGRKRETRQQAGQLTRQVPKGDILKIWNAILHCDHYQPGYQVTVPMLLAYGQRDTIVGLGQIKRLSPRWAAREADCRLLVVPDAGHNACMDNPDFVNSEILGFLEDLQES
ncbi:MAG: alpha/beta hydrolase [Phycisphaerae bacterium]|nr:alpha/beta hydrolase [Phycisphaerae bacterium]